MEYRYQTMLNTCDSEMSCAQSSTLKSKLGKNMKPKYANVPLDAKAHICTRS